MSNFSWINDLQFFFSTEQAFNIYPTGNMSYSEKLSSVLRFSVYFSVIMYLLKQNVKVFFLPVFIFMLTFTLRKFDESKNLVEEKYSANDCKHENETKEGDPYQCVAPTEDNPFMNVLMSDYATNVDRNPACNIQQTKTKELMKKKYEKRLYQNLDDIDDTENSFRQFYTTSSTTIPNDQDGFAKWLYFSEEKTCKEGNLTRCFR